MASTKGGLYRAQEAREASRRQADYRAQDLLRLNAEHHLISSNQHVMDRSEDHRRQRETRERQAEYAMQARVEEAQRDAAMKSRAAEQQTLITAELERRRREKDRQERFVQKVRIESDELRELAAKLAAAETTYERKLQLDEKAMIAAREAQYNSAFDARLTHERMQAEAEQAAAEAARRAEAVRARMVLEQQMEQRLELQAVAQYEAAIERDQLDALAAEIMAENAAAREERRRKQLATKEYVQRFLLEREDLRLQQRELELEEERKIAAYRAAVDARTAGVAAQKKAKAEEEARVFAKLAQEASEAQAKREAMEELISRLRYEEEEEKRTKAAEEKRRRADAARAEMIAANEAQRAAKASRLERERVEEDAFRAYMLAKFAEDDRVEQMNAQKRRMRMLDHKREVERLAAIKRAMYEEQRGREIAEQQADARREARVAAVVEQERQRMLVEHAARLMDYLPKGVLAKPEDLELIRAASLASTRGQPGPPQQRVAGPPY